MARLSDEQQANLKYNGIKDDWWICHWARIRFNILNNAERNKETSKEVYDLFTNKRVISKIRGRHHTTIQFADGTYMRFWSSNRFYAYGDELFIWYPDGSKSCETDLLPTYRVRSMMHQVDRRPDFDYRADKKKPMQMWICSECYSQIERSEHQFLTCSGCGAMAPYPVVSGVTEKSQIIMSMNKVAR